LQQAAICASPRTLGCTLQMLADLFQKQYDFEHQRRSEVTSATASPIAATTVLSGALSVALLDFPYSPTPLSWVFLALSLLTLGALGFAVLYAFRSTWNYVYEKLAPAPAIAAHFQTLLAWRLTQNPDPAVAKSLAEEDLREYVAEKLSAAADWNGQNNDRRGNFLHMSTTAIAIALALFVPTALLYAYAKATSPEKVHRVQLTGSPSHSQEQPMTTGNNQNAPAPAPAPSVPAAAPTVSQTKPAGPPNSQFRTNTELPSPQASSNSGKKPGQ
jgi:hypothetical protein